MSTPIYQGFQAQWQTVSSLGSNSLSNAWYRYKGKSLVGGCVAWNSYLSNTLSFPTDTYVVNSLVVSSGFEDISNIKLTYPNVSVTCNDAAVALGILNALKNALNTNAVSKWSCNGHSVLVYRCTSSVVMCIDCRANDCPCAPQSFSTGVCDDCSSSDAGRSSSYFVTSFQLAPRILYPEISYKGFSIGRSTVSFNLSVSTAGTVYCRAFAETEKFSAASISLIKSAGISVLSVYPKNILKVTISGLSPDTKYNVYCYAEDFSRHVMDLAAVNNTRRSVTTSCCRNIVWRSTYASIISYDNSAKVTENFFHFDLDSQPTKPTTIAISVSTSTLCGSSISNSAKSNAKAVPSNFAFTSNSISLGGDFVIRGSAGCYLVTAAVKTGTEYANISTVVSISSIPNPPILSYATFSSNGAKLLIGFDTDTDQGSSVISSSSAAFPCYLILTFSTANQNLCLWVSPRVILVTLGGYPLFIGDKLSLLAGVLRAACSQDLTACKSYAYSTTQSVVISAPPNPALPSPSVSAPSVTSICGDLTLDPTNSYGNVGRPWSKVSWTVSGAGDINAISRLLNWQYNDTHNLIPIPQSLLRNGSISFTLLVSNFLGGSAASSVTISVLADFSSPLVRVVGPSRINVNRWQDVSLSASATASSCSSSATKAVYYTWRVFRGSVYVPSFISYSLNPKTFRLPPYSLEASTVYLITATVSFSLTNSDLASTAAVQVIVGRTGVKAAIRGAASQVMSADVMNSLDASASIDVDYPQNRNLSYSWQCIEYSPSYGDPCNLRLNDSAIVYIPAGSFLNNTYKFDVFVSSLDDGATDHAFVLVTFVPTAIPKLNPAILQSKYNVGDKVVISVTVIAIRAMTYTWQASNSSVNISAISNTALTGVLSAGTITLQLVLQPNTLISELYYSFELQATYTYPKSAHSAAVQITIGMNAAPSGGSLIVTPTAGVALNTSFFFLTQSWQDDPQDYPLLYAMSHYTTDISDAVTVRAMGPSVFAFAYLAQGLESMSYAVTCVVQVTDYLNATNYDEYAITVRPSSSTLAVADALITNLVIAYLGSDGDLATQVAYSAATHFNSANCSGAPSCAALHREPCTVVPHTCGPCLSGFVGVPDSANSECKDRSTIRLDGVSCSSDNDCLSGKCSFGVCHKISKTCPGNCSSQGMCLFYNSLSGSNLSSCAYTDSFCFAKCNCSSGRYGADCSLDQSTLLLRQSLRESLCLSLYTALDYQVRLFHIFLYSHQVKCVRPFLHRSASPLAQDLDEGVLFSRAVSMASILLDHDQITDAALLNCTLALTSMVSLHPSLASSDQTAPAVLSALSNVIDRGLSTPASVLAVVSAAIKKLTFSRQDYLAVGEFSSLTSSNIRMHVAVLYAGNLNLTSLKLPQTPTEALVGEPATTAHILTTGDVYGTLTVSIAQYTKSPYGNATLVTGSIIVQTYFHDTPSSNEVQVVLRNSRAISRNQPLVTGQVNCLAAAHPYPVLVSCNVGYNMTVSCLGNVSGQISYTCPAQIHTMKCKLGDGVTFNTDESCRVVSYTSENTTCQCQGSSSSHRRLSAGETNPIIQEIGASLEIVTSNFVETWTSSENLNSNSATQNYIILSTVSCLMFLCVVGFCGLFMKENLQKKSLATNVSQSSSVDEILETVLPIEFSAKPWHVRFWEKSLELHPYLAMMSPERGRLHHRSKKWLEMTSHLLNMIFLNTVFYYLIVGDSSVCGSYTSREQCELPRNLDAVDRLCSWDSAQSNCKYNEPSNSLLSVLILTSLVVVCVVPMNVVCKHVIRIGALALLPVKRERQLPVKKQQGAAAEEVAAKSRSEEDTLVDWLHKNIDNASVEDEVNELQERWRRVWVDGRPGSDGNAVVRESESARNLASQYEMRFGINTELFVGDGTSVSSADNNKGPSKATEDLTRLVTDARMLAEKQRTRILALPRDDHKEILILKLFIVGLQSGYKRRVAMRYLYGEVAEGSGHVVQLFRYFCLGLIPLYFLGTLFYVFLFGVRLGQSATILWLQTLGLSALQSIFIIQPVVVWIRFVAMTSVVSDDLNEIVQLLKRLALRGKSPEELNDANQIIVVQHFNIGCRVARYFPELPLSKILCTVTDSDLPRPWVKNVGFWRRVLLQLLGTIFIVLALVLTVVSRLPGPAEEVLTQCFVSASLNIMFFGIYFLEAKSIVLPCVAAALILVTLMIREYIIIHDRGEAMDVTSAAVVAELLEVGGEPVPTNPNSSKKTAHIIDARTSRVLRNPARDRPRPSNGKVSPDSLLDSSSMGFMQYRGPKDKIESNEKSGEDDVDILDERYIDGELHWASRRQNNPGKIPIINSFYAEALKLETVELEDAQRTYHPFAKAVQKTNDTRDARTVEESKNTQAGGRVRVRIKNEDSFYDKWQNIK